MNTPITEGEFPDESRPNGQPAPRGAVYGPGGSPSVPLHQRPGLPPAWGSGHPPLPPVGRPQRTGQLRHHTEAESGGRKVLRPGMASVLPSRLLCSGPPGKYNAQNISIIFFYGIEISKKCIQAKVQLSRLWKSGMRGVASEF